MPSDIERADRISRQRALSAPFFGVALLSVQQWLFFRQEWNDISPVQLGIWAVLAILVLLTILTGGLWFTSARVRALANDEIARRSRERALVGGFTAAMLTALTVFVVSPFEPLEAQRAAHIIISLGLGVALLVFGLEESRALG